MSFNNPTRLFFDILHPELPDTAPAGLRALTPGEWQEFASLGRLQGVRPLLYFSLKRNGLLEVVPHEVREELHKAYLTHSVRNMKLYEDLKQIASWLHAAGIPVIALKGAHLAHVVYCNIALREIGDLDLLVPEPQVVKAYEILKEKGYRHLLNVCNDSEVWLKTHYHLAPLARNGSAMVELHWNLEMPDKCPIEEFWDRAGSVKLGDVDILCLSPEDLLLHLCHHISYHHQFSFGLRLFLDISHAIDFFGEKLDWKLIGERADRLGWSRGVFLALRVAQGLVGARVPRECWVVFKDSHHDDQMAEAAISLVMNAANVGRFTPHMAVFCHEQFLAAKMKKAWQRLFVPPEKLATFYPVEPNSLMRYWYYFVRLGHLLSRYTWVAWRFKNDETMPAKLARQKAILIDWLGPIE